MTVSSASVVRVIVGLVRRHDGFPLRRCAALGNAGSSAHGLLQLHSIYGSHVARATYAGSPITRVTPITPSAFTCSIGPSPDVFYF